MELVVGATLPNNNLYDCPTGLLLLHYCTRIFSGGVNCSCADDGNGGGTCDYAFTTTTDAPASEDSFLSKNN
jgi:hypothetical protein